MVAQETVRFLLAARNGDLSVLQADQVTESLEDDHGANCLHYGARGGKVEVLKYLVNTQGFKPTRRSKVGATALHDAAATGNLEALQWLLEQEDVKVDDQDGTGATVTHLSARYGHTQTVEWLLNQTNCDVLKKSASGAVALHFAAEGGHLECVKILIAEAPRSVNMQMNNGSTPAYLACQRGHLMTAEYLASKNGTPKIHTFDGMSPLHAAAQMGHLHIIKWLIKDQGLNPNERDFDGATPLHYAASLGHEEVLDWMLREGGARIILDNLGGSPLHSAAEFGNNRIARTLLSNGCDREITDNDGLTAQELAEKCGHLNTAALLRGEIQQETTQPQTLSPPPPPKVRPPSPLHPPPPRRRTTSNRSTTCQSSTTITNTTTNNNIPVESSSKPEPPPPAPKPSNPVLVRGTAAGPSAAQVSASIVVDSLENLPGSGSDGVSDRSMSVVSVASSASSFGYFSPHGGGKIEVVEVDVHDAPSSRVCVFSSQETGEREIVPCPLTARSSSSKFSDEEFSKAAASAKHYITSSASLSSQLPPIKSSYLSQIFHSESAGDTASHSSSNVGGAAGSQGLREEQVSSGSNRNSVPTQEPQESEKRSLGEGLKSQQREPLASVRERKTLLEAAAAGGRTSSSHPFVSQVSAMERVQGNGEVKDKTGSTQSVSSTGSSGSAKSVISISNKNVTIISTGRDGTAAPPKVSTTPLRKEPREADQVASQGPVSSRHKDSDFIATLSQKFQGSAPVPGVAAASGFKGSNSQSFQRGGEAPSLKPWQQQQQQQLQKRQQVPENSAAPPPPPPPPPPPVMNGHAEVSLTSQMNGHGGPGMVPPPPPPPPPQNFTSEQRAVRKPDASYTPRPKTYASVNGSIPGTPGGDSSIDQQKTDLMSALNVLVTSGSPCASLRKTNGPGKGGVNEVFSSKKSSGAMTNGTAKQPAPLPTIVEFDPKNFLDQVDKTDSSGNKIPDWKRHMKAKNLAQKAQEEYLEKKKVEEYEARFKNIPAWKRALIEKKEVANKAQQ